MSQTFMIWDGNGRFWCGDGSGENGKSGRPGEWAEDPKAARVWSSHLDAWAFSADVGGQVVTGAQAGELLSERAVLVRQWEAARGKLAEAQKKLAEAERHAAELEREYDAAGDKLGHFLAVKSAEKTGGKPPDGIRVTGFSAHLCYRGRVLQVQAGGLRTDQSGNSTDRVAYHFKDVGGSVFDLEAGKHTYPTQG